jgi:hypothetical protein
MTIRAVIYARTSSDRPISAEDQVNHLKIVAADHGWTISNVFLDRPGTLKKGRQRRPGEAALIEAIRRGEVQKTLMIGIDRVGQSLVELVAFLETCRIAGASLWQESWPAAIGSICAGRGGKAERIAPSSTSGGMRCTFRPMATADDWLQAGLGHRGEVDTADQRRFRPAILLGPRLRALRPRPIFFARADRTLA